MTTSFIPAPPAPKSNSQATTERVVATLCFSIAGSVGLFHLIVIGVLVSWGVNERQQRDLIERGLIGWTIPQVDKYMGGGPYPFAPSGCRVRYYDFPPCSENRFYAVHFDVTGHVSAVEPTDRYFR